MLDGAADVDNDLISHNIREEAMVENKPGKTDQ